MSSSTQSAGSPALEELSVPVVVLVVVDVEVPVEVGEEVELVPGSVVEVGAGPTVSGCVSGDRLLCGADFFLGLGRLPLDLVVSYSHWPWTLTWTTYKRAVSPSPMPANNRCIL